MPGAVGNRFRREHSITGSAPEAHQELRDGWPEQSRNRIFSVAGRRRPLNTDLFSRWRGARIGRAGMAAFRHRARRPIEYSEILRRWRQTIRLRLGASRPWGSPWVVRVRPGTRPWDNWGWGGG